MKLNISYHLPPKQNTLTWLYANCHYCHNRAHRHHNQLHSAAVGGEYVVEGSCTAMHNYHQLQSLTLAAVYCAHPVAYNANAKLIAGIFPPDIWHCHVSVLLWWAHAVVTHQLVAAPPAAFDRHVPNLFQFQLLLRDPNQRDHSFWPVDIDTGLMRADRMSYRRCWRRVKQKTKANNS